MNIDALQTVLEPWLGADTWHTRQLPDRQRFHQTLKMAFETLGTSITLDEFKSAMLKLAEKRHPNMPGWQREQLIEAYAHEAESIGSYLDDTSTMGIFDSATESGG